MKIQLKEISCTHEAHMSFLILTSIRYNNPFRIREAANDLQRDTG